MTLNLLNVSITSITRPRTVRLTIVDYTSKYVESLSENEGYAHSGPTI